MNLDTLGFNLGDIVTGRKTGNYIPSKIVAFMPAILYVNAMAPKSPFTKWCNEYPNWHDEMVAVCVFSEPTRPVTFDEYESQVPDTKLHGLAKQYPAILHALYETEVPLSQSAVYPIADLMEWKD